MTKLKLGTLVDDKPVKLSIELPAGVHRDLVAYAQILARSSGGATPPDPAKLVPQMVARFMATDREFMRQRRKHLNQD